jgi:hypothetical protein
MVVSHFEVEGLWKTYSNGANMLSGNTGLLEFRSFLTAYNRYMPVNVFSSGMLLQTGELLKLLDLGYWAVIDLFANQYFLRSTVKNVVFVLYH